MAVQVSIDTAVQHCEVSNRGGSSIPSWGRSSLVGGWVLVFVFVFAFVWDIGTEIGADGRCRGRTDHPASLSEHSQRK